MSRTTRRLLLAAGMVLLAALATPFLGADRFASGLQWRLEQALGRKVEIKGQVSLYILPRPGFSAEQVVVHEDATFGVEPLAYVSTLETDISLTALLLARKEISSIRLVEPSINLTHAGGKWNTQALLDQVTAQAEAAGNLPDLEVQGGRVNLKFDDTKAVLYLADTDLKVEAGSGSQIDVQFSGEPARTDRPSRAFGRLSGRGWIRRGPGAGAMDLSLSIQRTAIAEIATLAQGRSSGLGGLVAARARLRGPLDNVAITGRLELEEFERLSWLLPEKAGWGLDYRGNLNLLNETMHMETHSADGESLPLSVRFRASDLIRRPNWAVLATLRELPFSSLRSLAEETDAAFPKMLNVDGKLSGALGYSASAGLHGQVKLEAASVIAPEFGKLQMADASVIVRGSETQLLPTRLELENNGRMMVDMRYDGATGEADVRMQGTEVPSDSLREGWKRMFGSALPEPMELCRGGSWTGTLRYNGNWSGEARLEGATCRVDGVAGELNLVSAPMRLRGESVEIGPVEAALAGLPVRGSYRLEPSRLRTHQVQLAIERASLDEISRLLAPALSRGQSFLDRTLRRRAAIPAWLAGRRMEINLRVGSLMAAGQALHNFRSRWYWNGGQIEIRDIAAEVAEGTVSGTLLVDLAPPSAGYQARLEMHDLAWQGGRLDLDTTLEGTGIGETFFASLRLNGTYQARNVMVEPELEWRSGTGCFQYAPAQGGSRLQLTAMQTQIGGETFHGHGQSGADGSQPIEAAGTARQLRWAGRLQGLKLELVSAR